MVGTLAGRTEAYDFTRNGEKIAVAAKLQLLIERRGQGADAVQLVEVAGTVLDRCQPPIDHAKLAVGDRIELDGECVIQDRGSDRESFFQVTSARLAAASPSRNGAGDKATVPTTA